MLVTSCATNRQHAQTAYTDSIYIHSVYRQHTQTAVWAVGCKGKEALAVSPALSDRERAVAPNALVAAFLPCTAVGMSPASNISTTAAATFIEGAS